MENPKRPREKEEEMGKGLPGEKREGIGGTIYLCYLFLRFSYFFTRGVLGWLGKKKLNYLIGRMTKWFASGIE